MTDRAPATAAYREGRAVGEQMAANRSKGDDSYDCRWDLADAAKIGTNYFSEFKRGLEDGLRNA